MPRRTVDSESSSDQHRLAQKAPDGDELAAMHQRVSSAHRQQRSHIRGPFGKLVGIRLVELGFGNAVKQGQCRRTLCLPEFLVGGKRVELRRIVALGGLLVMGLVESGGQRGQEPGFTISTNRCSEEIRCPSCQAMWFIPGTGRTRMSESLRSPM